MHKVAQQPMSTEANDPVVSNLVGRTNECYHLEICIF